MPISTYSGLMTEIMRLIDGEDITGAELPTQSLAQIIHFGELRIYREIRSRYNEKAWPATAAASNLIALPSDFIAASVVHFGKTPLYPLPENELLERLYLYTGSGGNTTHYCNAGPNFSFFPAVADGTTMQGRYYYKLPDLDETTFSSNTLVAANEDLFVYAALSISAPYFGQDARIPLWDAEYSRIRDEINVLEHTTAYSSGRIKRGPNMRIVP
jgi:hypothetical protein